MGTGQYRKEWPNVLPPDEVDAVHQYMVHSEICDRWSFGREPGNLFRRNGYEKSNQQLLERVLMMEEIAGGDDLKWPRFKR
jgi:bacterioferritin (cytochrome b1)